jgi:glycosyltransferase EpsD
VTINQEDFHLAHKHRFSAKSITLINGVGVDVERFHPINSDVKGYYRFKNGYGQEDFLLFYAAECNDNKNQQLLIHILAKLKTKIPNTRLLLAGEGPLLEKYRYLAAKLGVIQHIDFLGYRTDVHELLPMCDLAVASSKREGLPVNIMEAMACEIPVVATSIRGHHDLVQDYKTGHLFDPTNIDQAVYQIEALANSPMKRKQFGRAARQLILDKFSITNITRSYSEVYNTYMQTEKSFEKRGEYEEAHRVHANL